MFSPDVSKEMNRSSSVVFLVNCRRDCSLQRRDDLDQCRATVETVLKRLDLLENDEILPGKRLLLLGDDDFLSLAIMRKYPTADVSVFDLDFDLLEYLGKQHPLANLKRVHVDLQRGFPEDYLASFDAVFTDPPYTLAGQLLFLSRAIQAIKQKKGSRIYLCASRLYLKEDDIEAIEALATKSGHLLSTLYPEFNKYETPPDVAVDMIRLGMNPLQQPFISNLYSFVSSGDVVNSAIAINIADNIYDYRKENV